jgi:hypothetical protein
MMEGLHRGGGLLPFFGWTVDPASPAAEALRKTEQYRAAFTEAKSWQSAEGIEVCEPSCDVFALNATANGWVVGEKIEAIGNHTPVVNATHDGLVAMGRKPVDLDTLGQEAPEPAPGPEREPVSVEAAKGMRPWSSAALAAAPEPAGVGRSVRPRR